MKIETKLLTWLTVRSVISLILFIYLMINYIEYMWIVFIFEIIFLFGNIIYFIYRLYKKNEYM